MLDVVTGAPEGGEHCLAVFCHLSRAFDSISHKILIDKLESYGIRGAASRLLTSYFAERRNIIGVDSVRGELAFRAAALPRAASSDP